MMTLVFATNNEHKLEEVRKIAGTEFRILSLSEIDCHDDIPETADTLEGNALLKARYVKEHYGYDCFADDTGLEVDALGGAPGVYSARYAGHDRSAEANMNKLLDELNGVENRTARFRTVIALILRGEEHLFEGSVEGRILTDKRGASGFGYDPLFVPEGYDLSFAEMGNEMKNDISHRARAVRRLEQFLERLSPADGE